MLGAFLAHLARHTPRGRYRALDVAQATRQPLPVEDICQRRPQPRAQWFPPAAWEDTGAMVRPYVAHLGSAPRTARTGCQADPWGND